MKIVKWILISFATVSILLFLAFQFMKFQTKQYSPEQEAELIDRNLRLSVFYNSPAKKGREIFGELVPYGEVWRTGANEATTFTTNQTILIEGKPLPAGKYTLWTIPNEDSWQVIFNEKMYSWGVGLDGLASREATADVLTVEVPTEEKPKVEEHFKIIFDESNGLYLVMKWDRTAIKLEIKS